MSWQQQERRNLFQSPYIEVWEDTVLLPSGRVINDYSGVDLPDGVLVVATDVDGNLLLFDEYKYAVDDTVFTFPAGGIDGDETPEQAALRELREETGYVATEAQVLMRLYPYPSKINHANYIVRVRNATKSAEFEHSPTEEQSIGALQKVAPHEIRSLIKSGKVNTSYVLAALALAFPNDI